MCVTRAVSMYRRTICSVRNCRSVFGASRLQTASKAGGLPPGTHDNDLIFACNRHVCNCASCSGVSMYRESTCSVLNAFEQVSASMYRKSMCSVRHCRRKAESYGEKLLDIHLRMMALLVKIAYPHVCTMCPRYSVRPGRHACRRAAAGLSS